ncbi:MAG: AbrB/MazE/SpoVT family DNA-binding domain-containing protein, partial [Clostridia bacterium]|nr:AbrB/MazE/SpoVT family DNA-binding domain-containing protein [Clostridia bacterium]
MPANQERKARTAMLKQVTVDELGRIVIPMPMRKELGIAVRDRLTIKAVDDRIILTKAVSTCALCGATDELVALEEKHLCAACVRKIRAL